MTSRTITTSATAQHTETTDLETVEVVVIGGGDSVVAARTTARDRTTTISLVYRWSTDHRTMFRCSNGLLLNPTAHGSPAATLTPRTTGFPQHPCCSCRTYLNYTVSSIHGLTSLSPTDTDRASLDLTAGLLSRQIRYIKIVVVGVLIVDANDAEMCFIQ